VAGLKKESEYLDLVGKNRKVRGFHDRVLSQLLGIIRMGLTSKYQPLVAPNNLKAPDHAL
jgi:hypothetical protein